MTEIEDDYAEKAQDAIANLASSNPQKAMATICGLLVGLIEYQAELQGYDGSQEITIDPDGDGRSITISAVKELASER